MLDRSAVDKSAVGRRTVSEEPAQRSQQIIQITTNHPDQNALSDSSDSCNYHHCHYNTHHHNCNGNLLLYARGLVLMALHGDHDICLIQDKHFERLQLQRFVSVTPVHHSAWCPDDDVVCNLLPTGYWHMPATWHLQMEFLRSSLVYWHIQATLHLQTEFLYSSLVYWHIQARLLLQTEFLYSS